MEDTDMDIEKDKDTDTAERASWGGCIDSERAERVLNFAATTHARTHARTHTHTVHAG
jgi:hypothetical protein